MSPATGAPRPLGASGLAVAPVGFGSWAIGGPATRNGGPAGWGDVDDDESVAAIHSALDGGITFIDTAAMYGAGHSERVIGRAIKGRRDALVIGTKFGVLFDEDTRSFVAEDATPASILEQCEASLRRLGIETFDLYQFHLPSYDLALADVVVDALDALVESGKIRAFGWSTDDIERIERFAKSPHCAAAQVRFNLVEGTSELALAIERLGLAGINHSPLAMGVLTGKFNRRSTFSDDDHRRVAFDFEHGRQARSLAAIERMRETLGGNGRTLAQGALCWLMAKSPAFIPIPGIRTVAQAEENAAAIALGPLSAAEMAEIDGALGDLAAT